MSQLSGSVAVVTGAGRGIGRSVARHLARRGANVVVVDNGSEPDGSGRDDGPAREVAAEIVAAGGRAVAEGADVTQADEVRAVVDSAIARWGRLDVLVNVAGNIRLDSIADTSVADFESLLRTHVVGTFLTTTAVVPHWMRQRFGRLVNFSSVAGLNVGFPALLSYSTAKAAVLGFTRSCANFLVSYGVTANCVCPAADTRMGASVRGVRDEGSPAWNDPAHVAPLVAHLASRDASHVTGRVFGASRGRYTLWTEPSVEAVFEVDALAHMEDFDRAIAAMCTGLDPAQLPQPAAPVEPDWRDRYGLFLPPWRPDEHVFDASTSPDRSLA